MTRTQCVMKAIGWQGGTVHQLCEHLGLEPYDFLYAKPKATYTGSEYNKGLYWNTNSPRHQKGLQKSQKGNLDYWLGVARCIEVVEK